MNTELNKKLIMKTLKIIGIVIIALVAMFLITAIFVPKEYSVTREVLINKSNSEIFNYLKYLKNQDNFSVWSKMDPNMKKEFKGTDGTIGFISSWDSDNKDVGKGEQEIIKITNGKRIDFELRFKEPFEETDYAYFTTEEIDSITTKVVWGLNGKMNYPMNIMMLFMNFDDLLGKDLEAGLNNLKNLSE